MCSWNALNDYLDLEIDRVNRPDRPLPSGAISEATARRAIALMMTLSILSIVWAAVTASGLEGGIDGWYPALAIWAGALFLLANYESAGPFSLRLKERGLPGNIAISLSVGMVVLFGAAGVFEPFSHRAWAMFVVGVLYTIAREIVKDVEDMEGDEGRSTPASTSRRLGAAVADAGFYPTALHNWGIPRASSDRGGSGCHPSADGQAEVGTI